MNSRGSASRWRVGPSLRWPVTRPCRRTLLAVLLALAPGPAAGQPAPGPAEPEDVIRLPEIRLTAPTRLPHDPLPASSIPASVQVLTGEDLRRSGAASLQDLLIRRLPGATLSDEQGNALQPSLLLRGFQVSPITGAPQGLSVFVDGVRVTSRRWKRSTST